MRPKGGVRGRGDVAVGDITEVVVKHTPHVFLRVDGRAAVVVQHVVDCRGRVAAGPGVVREQVVGAVFDAHHFARPRPAPGTS